MSPDPNRRQGGLETGKSGANGQLALPQNHRAAISAQANALIRRSLTIKLDHSMGADHQAGYDDGYEAARFPVCREWQLVLPANMRDRYTPKVCR